MQNERERVGNSDATSIPEEIVLREYTKLSRRLVAIPLEEDSAYGARLGTVRQLPEGMKVAVCGDGFNAKTVKVQTEDGAFYFVFAEDLALMGR